MTDDRALALRMLADMFGYYRLEPLGFRDGDGVADFMSDALGLALLLDAAPDDPRTDELIADGWRVLALSGAQVRGDPASVRQTLLDTALALGG